jgi:hypothetical protein
MAPWAVAASAISVLPEIAGVDFGVLGLITRNDAPATIKTAAAARNCGLEYHRRFIGFTIGITPLGTLSRVPTIRDEAATNPRASATEALHSSHSAT